MSSTTGAVWRSTDLVVEAPAKINLALHVTGRREDGYHLLDSLVAFSKTGDRLIADLAGTFSFSISGPFGTGLSITQNLVIDAINAYRTQRGLPLPPIRLELEKNLPVASGIGGGSADAAAALRLMTRMDDTPIGRKELERIALALGADVPVCLQSAATRMGGIGENLTSVPALPETGIVLVNPGRGVATPDVFRVLRRRDNPPLPEFPSRFADRRALKNWLDGTRNDLQVPAGEICTAIGDVLGALDHADGIEFARMSGSGATCFGLCAPDKARNIANALRSKHPEWWWADGLLS